MRAAGRNVTTTSAMCAPSSIGTPRARDASASWLDGRFAKAALRNTDRAAERLVVGGIGDELEIRHEVADLAAVIEANRADEAIRHGVSAQRFLERAALRVRSIEHGDVVQPQRRRRRRGATLISPMTKSASSRSSSDRTTVTGSPEPCVARSVFPIRPVLTLITVFARSRICGVDR